MAEPVAPDVEVQVGDGVPLQVRAMASSGAGLGDLPDGRVAFVHRTVPGDRIHARVTRLRPRWGEASLVEVLEAGPSRVEPPCPLYTECGGCTLQHMAYPDQLAWKGRFVSDALRRIGGITVEAPPVTPAPDPFHYRNRVTFTVRTLSPMRVVAGFHALGVPDRIVDVGGECLLPEGPILKTWRALRVGWARGIRPLPASRELRVTLRALDDGGVVFVVKGGSPGWDPEGLVALLPDLVAIWHQPDGAREARRVHGDDAFETWGPDRVPMGGHAFLQVNRAAAQALHEHVMALAGDPGSVVDAYCGIGVYGRALARKGWRARGIELDGHACHGARLDPPPGFAVLEGKVEDHLDQALPADLVILNPPRTGVHERVPEILLAHRPARLVYVSCDPATLARDLKALGGVYHLEALHAFDLFPQTSHVESVAVLTLGPPEDRNH